MGFGAAVRSGLSKFASFSGRARRSEFWWFYLFSVLVVIAGAVIDAVAGTEGIFYGLAAVAVILPNIAVGVRRLHDIDKSGWLYLLYLIPLVGTILLIVWGCKEGTSGPNQYGADPKGGMDEHGYSPAAQPR